MICDNFQFNVIWHGQNVAALFYCWRLAESDITVMRKPHAWIDFICDINTQLM